MALLSIPLRTHDVAIAASSVKAIPAPPTLPVIFKKIQWCESQNRQFNSDGSVHRGVANHQDVGLYQINEHWNLKQAVSLGYNIYTLDGNTAMALFMYQHLGTTPWNWSKPCWNNSDTTSAQWQVRFMQNKNPSV